MGQLHEQALPSLFNGVSRQPDIVRLHNQVEDATNALFSVVSGGFEKRPASVAVAKLNLDTAKKWHVHLGERTASERLFYCVNEDGDLRVFDADTGTEKTISPVPADIKTYLSSPDPKQDLVFVTVEDYTFAVNRNVVTAMGAVDSSKYVDETKEFDLLPGIRDYPQEGDVWRINNGSEQSDDQYYRWETDMWVLQWTGAGFPTNLTIKGQDRNFEDLPPALPPDPADGDIWKVANSDTQDDDYFVKWDNALEKWVETADPFIVNAFDLTTMPHGIVVENGGTVTAKQIPWEPRGVGDALTVPEPKFIGKRIADLFFHKSRLGFVSDEWTVLTRHRDFFNFWPDKSTQALDTDPVDRTAKHKKAVYLRWAIPFRKTLFMTSDNAQFELSSDNFLTPKDASVDLATTYNSSIKCRPVVMGDELYFTATTQDRALLFEYYYDDNTISNTAGDVTKHVGEYIRPDITKMTADPTTGTLWAYSEGRTSGVYIYNTYWDAEQKIQSAWNFWDLGVDELYDIEFVGSYLYVLSRRGVDTFIEKISPVREAAVSDVAFNPLLDVRYRITGTYDSGTNTTSWTLPFTHSNEAEAYLTDGYGGKSGRCLILTYDQSDPYLVKVTGDYSAHPVYAGMPYEMNVTFSKQYVKDEQGNSILTGRLQLRRWTIYFDDSTYFEVWKTPKARERKVYKMTGRILGDVSNQVGKISKAEGKFRFSVNSRADTAKIQVVNDTAYPSVITACQWVGFFNQISRQDEGYGS